MVMVPKEQCCKQTIKTGRQCSLKAIYGEYCHQHNDRSYFARVSYRTGISKGHLDHITAALVDEMGWEHIKAFNEEGARGQLYDDAGGYLVRCIGRLFGARTRYDNLDVHKQALTRAFGVSNDR